MPPPSRASPLRLLTLCLAILAHCFAGLSSFTADTIAIALPATSDNCSLAEEITGILSRHWMFKTDWAEMRRALTRGSSVAERSGYLGSLGDPYCRLLRPAEMARKSFRGTHLSSGIAVARDYSSLLRRLGRTFRTELVCAGDGPPTPLPTLSPSDAVQLAANVVLPLSLLVLHVLPLPPSPSRSPLFQTLYRTGLSAALARSLGRCLCPVQVRDTHPALEESYPGALAKGDEILRINGRRVSLLSSRKLQSLLDHGEVVTP